MSSRADFEKRDPYWGAQLIAAAAIVLELALPDKLTIGPSWLLPGLEVLVGLGLIAASPLPLAQLPPAAADRDRR